jgi:hypothetical protein
LENLAHESDRLIFQDAGDQRDQWLNEVSQISLTVIKKMILTTIGWN